MRRLFTNKRGQFIVIAILFISIMIISVAVFVYSTVTYYRYQRWEEYLTIVDNIRRNSQKVLRIGLANFTQNFLEGRVRDKGEYEAYTLRGLFNSWERDLQKIYAGIGIDLEFNAVGNRLIASKWTVNNSSHIIKCFWYGSDSVSSAFANISISLSSYGFYGYHIVSEEYLRLQVDTSYMESELQNITSLNVIVTKEGENPVCGLSPSNFLIKRFDREIDTWRQVNVTDVAYDGEGNYTLHFESDPIEKPYYKWLFISVRDQRGIVTLCSTYSYIEFIVQRETPSDGRVTDDEIYTLEAGINGTWYWNGVKLNVASEGGDENVVTPPIPPVPIRLFRVNVTESGEDSDWTVSPCQYEVWEKIEWHDRLIDVPRDLADINLPFNASNRIVFQVSFPAPNITRQKVRIWWENDLDAPPYQGESDLVYNPGDYTAMTNRYTVEFIGVGHTMSDDYPYDYYGVAALLMKDPETGLCFGPWNIHAFGIYYGCLGEWRPYGRWEIKYWYGGNTSSRAVVRLIAILNSTEVQNVYYQYGHSDSYFDTFAVIFITANVKYLQVKEYIYWKNTRSDYGLWFASIMGKGGPTHYAYLDSANNTQGPYAYNYYNPRHREYESPGYWCGHWNNQFGRGLIINSEGLSSLYSFDPSRTRFSVTESAPGGAPQGSIELEAVNCQGSSCTVYAGTYYSYGLAMWMYDGGGYGEINNYYWMFLEAYSPTIIIEEGE